MKNNILFFIAIFCCACATSPTVIYNGTIIYEGPLYGDFINLFYKVENCMGKTNIELPHLVITTEPFEFFTILAYSCAIEGKIIVEAKKVVETKGALFSHESVHHILGAKGVNSHNNPFFESCGTISLEDFHL